MTEEAFKSDCQTSQNHMEGHDPLSDETSFIGLRNVSGSDVDVVNSARVSYAKRTDKMTEKDEKLMRFLVKNKHETPFEHNQLVFEVKAPIFVFREWHRHRVGWSYNEWSMRYLEGGKDVDLEFYLPAVIRKQSQSNRQASGEDMACEDSLTCKTDMLAAYSASFNCYRSLISKGVAKELARSVLPVGLYSSMWATCNLRSLMHFLSLRISEDAQWEIRQYAKAMLKIAYRHFPVSMGMWCDIHGYTLEGNKKG